MLVCVPAQLPVSSDTLTGIDLVVLIERVVICAYGVKGKTARYANRRRNCFMVVLFQLKVGLWGSRDNPGKPGYMARVLGNTSNVLLN